MIENEVFKDILRRLSPCVGGVVDAARHIKISPDEISSPDMMEFGMTYTEDIGIEVTAYPEFSLLMSALKSIPDELISVKLDGMDLVVSGRRSEWRVPCVDGKVWSNVSDRADTSKDMIHVLVSHKDVFERFRDFVSKEDLEWTSSPIMTSTGIFASDKFKAILYEPDGWSYEGLPFNTFNSALSAISSIEETFHLYKTGAVSDQWEIRWRNAPLNLEADPAHKLMSFIENSKGGLGTIKANRIHFEDLYRSATSITADHGPIHIEMTISNTQIISRICVLLPEKRLLTEHTCDCESDVSGRVTFERGNLNKWFKPHLGEVSDFTFQLLKDDHGSIETKPFAIAKKDMDDGVLTTLVAGVL